ncbi:MAG: cupin domain-containing protein [Candidatus Poribacteria bacterium]|nr:cupin domain-containing protein [Candidatus Poribacteria bacterium]
MSGKFIPAAQADREQLDWGTLAWLSRPQTTGAKDLVVIEVNLSPGGGHDFHKHPEQEEVIYVIEGTVEQWLREEKQMLSSGDSVFIPADTVHASFNTSGSTAKLLAILGPCVGSEGYELVDVSADAPWNGLR